MNTSGTLCCHWCGIDLSMASCIVYLNGNLPVCDLCLTRAKSQKKVERCWCGKIHDPEEHLVFGTVVKNA